jgi:3-hydroxyisobutyrate dehydrogenase-like beta-hydroxyacid dehydrogenase
MADGPRIGFVGLGNMGRPMAANLLKAGYRITVTDLRPESATDLITHGATWADSPMAVARASRVTFTSLPGPREIEQVVLGREGILEGAQAPGYYIDVSTNEPSCIRHIASEAARKGVHVLDAPVSGGVRGARTATLVFMVGGDRAAFDYCAPLLRNLGERVFYTGPVGSGTITKLVNNYMGLSNAIASMEAVVLGARAGVDPRTLIEVVDVCTGASHMTHTLYPYLIFKRNFDPAKFSMALASKDFRMAIDLAHELGVEVHVGEAVAESLERGVTSGLAERDFSAYVTLLEQAAGVEVRE